MIEMGKQYRTRDGREVRIYATDGVGGFPVHGAVFFSDGWRAERWTSCGTNIALTCLALIEVKPRIKRTIWVSVYDGYCTHWLIKPNPPKDCLALVKVEIDCEEGEGLSDD
jgi:hypothetical protein